MFTPNDAAYALPETPLLPQRKARIPATSESKPWTAEEKKGLSSGEALTPLSAFVASDKEPTARRIAPFTPRENPKSMTPTASRRLGLISAESPDGAKRFAQDSLEEIA